MKTTKLNLQFLLACLLACLVMVSCKSRTGQQAEQAEEEKVAEAAQPNTLTPEEKDQGWMLMFDGETTRGWKSYNGESFPEAGWTIEDGALKCIGSGKGEAGGEGGDIIYDEKLEDFLFKFEWKISEGGNSGVFYLAQETPGEPIWKSAPEYQILDNERHPDAMLGENGNRQAGSLYDLIPADPQNAKPAGEWNTGQILVYQGTVVHYMNGEKVLEYHLGTSDWEKMIEESKFSEFPEFGKHFEGYIGLQDHGNDVWYRSMKLKKM